MNLKYRKTIIAGNWKMHLNADEAKKFILRLKPKAVQARWCDVVLCVPFLQIPAAVKAACTNSRTVRVSLVAMT